eukprot:IDg2614t1
MAVIMVGMRAGVGIWGSAVREWPAFYATSAFHNACARLSLTASIAPTEMEELAAKLLFFPVRVSTRSRYDGSVLLHDRHCLFFSMSHISRAACARALNDSY